MKLYLEMTIRYKKIKLKFSKTYLLINEKDRLLEDGKL
jgi:hypothetical protein